MALREDSLGFWLSRVEPGALERLVVISPHFDDAVLGCGQLIAALPPVTVVTVMGGAKPGGYDEVTWWDSFGFTAGDDVVAARRQEDAAALEVLGARSSYLHFIDHQYGVPAVVEEVAEALTDTLAELEPSAVLVPFGLVNPDHETVGAACIQVLRAQVDAGGASYPWLAYAEVGYSAMPDVLCARLAGLREAKVMTSLVSVSVPEAREAKARALACYASQLPALADDWGYDPAVAVEAPENYWVLTGRP